MNLSAKAICGLGAYAQLCAMRGDQTSADKYRAVAEEFAARWVDEAQDGDHYRLAFDRPGTWSQKYNLVWDRVLDLNLFPESVYQNEMAFYRRSQNRYGLPLDNRQEYTKLDWVLWTATLTENRDDFSALVQPVVRFLNETPDRMAMTDWYETVSGKKVGFTARPVVGGVFMQMLYKEDVWKKWAGRDRVAAGNYAKLPLPPRVVTQVAAADTEAASWRYSTTPPQGNWRVAQFDDSKWQQGEAGFGTEETPGAHVGTVWDSPDIWLRRTFDLPAGAGDGQELLLHMHHDEDVQVFINGARAFRRQDFTTGYENFQIRPEALATLMPTGNVLAIHCHQTTGGQYIDAGLVTLTPANEQRTD